MEKNSAFLGSKKYIFVQPEKGWPRPPARFLSMETISVDKDSGEKLLTFRKSPEYESLQKEFRAVQATMSIENMM